MENLKAIPHRQHLSVLCAATWCINKPKHLIQNLQVRIHLGFLYKVISGPNTKKKLCHGSTPNQKQVQSKPGFLNFDFYDRHQNFPSKIYNYISILL